MKIISHSSQPFPQLTFQPFKISFPFFALSLYFDRINALKKKLLLSRAYRGVQSQTAKDAEDYVSSSEQELEKGDCWVLFKQYFHMFNPLLYLPFSKAEDRKFNIVQPVMIFKWIVVIIGIFLEWFSVSVSCYIYQSMSADDALSLDVLIAFLIALIVSIILQPVIFLLVWGYYEIYTVMISKSFRCDISIKKESGLALTRERGRTDSLFTKSVVLDLGSGPNSTSRHDFLGGHEKSNRGLTLEDPSFRAPNESQIISKKQTISTLEDEAIVDDVGEFNESSKRNDGNFIERFTVFALGIVLTMGIFSGLACFTISAKLASIVLVSFTFAFILDTLFLRIIIIICIAVIKSCCRKKTEEKNEIDSNTKNFLTKEESAKVTNAPLSTVQQTDMSHLIHQETVKGEEKKEGLVIKESNDNPKSSLEAAQEDAPNDNPESKQEGNIEEIPEHERFERVYNNKDPAAEEERKWEELASQARTLNDFNRILLRKIYTTYEPGDSDKIVKKWKESDTTEEIRNKNPENFIWEDAQELAILESTQRRVNMGETGVWFCEPEDSANMSFTEPPNIAGGAEIEKQKGRQNAAMFKNIGIRGLTNPKLYEENKAEQEFLEIVDLPPAEVLSPRSAALQEKEKQKILSSKQKNESGKISTRPEAIVCGTAKSGKKENKKMGKKSPYYKNAKGRTYINSHRKSGGQTKTGNQAPGTPKSKINNQDPNTDGINTGFGRRNSADMESGQGAIGSKESTSFFIPLRSGNSHIQRAELTAALGLSAIEKNKL